MTIEELREKGTIIGTQGEGTCQLWEAHGIEYVVLCDNTVITREEDRALGDPIFSE